MEKKYTLSSEHIKIGRTLWNNLVMGHKTAQLNIKDTNFKIKYREKDICIFDYKNNAEIVVTKPSYLTIKAKNEEQFMEVETKLKKICNEKSVPLEEILY